MRLLSLCTGMGLLDRAFLDAGFEVVPGCEIDPEQRDLYAQLCGGQPLTHDLADLPDLVRGQSFDGIIGGPPCQAHTKMRAMRKPKFGDLTPSVKAALTACSWRWFLFENVRPVYLGLGERYVRLDAMHFGQPHQSRPRYFTFSNNLTAPKRLYEGSVDDLMAHCVVMGRIYGPKRGARLQGYPAAADLQAPCVALQKGLANAVHYGLGFAWAKQALALKSAPGG